VVLETLLAAGHESYLVGGGVRDLLLDLHPKDFDVATAAEPEQVRQLFRSCRLIGRRFRLAHVRVGREIVEVATFRAAHDPEGDGQVSDNGRIVRDNVYGSLEEDAERRDVTINCLYYDVRNETLLDFAGGFADLKSRTLRFIGDPEQRYREDPVRILRVLRFAAKLGFDIEPGTEAPIRKLASLLRDIPPARLFDECMKLFLTGHAFPSWRMLERYGIAEELFPPTMRSLQSEGDERFLAQAMTNTDKRIAEGKPVTPGFLFAALLWSAAREQALRLQAEGRTAAEAIELAGSAVIRSENERVSVPRRFALMAKEIWGLQPRLEQPRGRRTLAVLARPRFRAAYDFLALRHEAGEEGLGELVRWWTELQGKDEGERERAVRRSSPGRAPRSRRRRRAAAVE
jgi:poly(A) polymerase